MGLISFLIVLFVWGLVMGALARLALPGPDPMSIPMTAALGIGGSLVGGVVARIFLGYGGGFVFAFLGSVLLLYLHRRLVQRRPLTGPGGSAASPYLSGPDPRRNRRRAVGRQSSPCQT